MNKRITVKPVVWIIDSQQWPRAYLRAELTERGFEVIGFVELSGALAALHDPEYLTPRLIVLELLGQTITKDDLDALMRSGISAIALGGAAELSDERVRGYSWIAIIRRPFSIGHVADVVEQLMGRA